MLRLPCILFFLVAFSAPGLSLAAETCVECHRTVTPGIVTDWQLSGHSKKNVGCAACHGEDHTSDKDVAKARPASPETCRRCHAGRVTEFEQGKHAKAWNAAIALPTTHWQPMAQVEDMRYCSGCHKIGFKSEAQIKELRSSGGFGTASCDACHTRHTFSAQEAGSPRSCRTCHMGIDHPQWEMFESNKHGVRYQLKQEGILPAQAGAPTCQTCHMPEGTHANRTAWGYLGLRLPLPFDQDWARDRLTIFKALGLLDPEGEPTPRMELFKTFDVMRFTNEDWLAERTRMLTTCKGCHSERFARAELEKGDAMIREADRLLAEAVSLVAGQYGDGAIRQPSTATYAFPDLLSPNNQPALIETRLFRMFIEHRMSAFQGAFHSNPNYAFWHGLSEMQRQLREIRAMAETRDHAAAGQADTGQLPAGPETTGVQDPSGQEAPLLPEQGLGNDTGGHVPAFHPTLPQ